MGGMVVHHKTLFKYMRSLLKYLLMLSHVSNTVFWIKYNIPASAIFVGPMINTRPQKEAQMVKVANVHSTLSEF